MLLLRHRVKRIKAGKQRAEDNSTFSFLTCSYRPHFYATIASYKPNAMPEFSFAFAPLLLLPAVEMYHRIVQAIAQQQKKNLNASKRLITVLHLHHKILNCVYDVITIRQAAKRRAD